MATTRTGLPTTAADPPAGYTVVARRYRPQQFADLIGQEHVAKALTNAITSGRIAHAFLFTGARGTGKTSTARILAKALNCVEGPTATPCDVCDICKSVANGDDVDVLEIDGASNNKVDEIRDLKSNVGFRPQRARFKIYIIDEVHMLSNSAFNALLKTLEEPPPHVKFLFATTEVQKIPITILSRCQRFDFAAIGPAKVFETLKYIVKKEGLEADEDALHIIARRAAGSMRDAQTLLDQLLGFSDGKLTADKLHALLGTAGDDRVGELAGAILAKDAAAALDIVAKSAGAGLQLGELLDQLIDYWRGLMLVHVAGAAARDLPGTPSLHQRIRDHAAGGNLDTVLAGLDILTAAKVKARASAHVQVLLEVAVVRLSRLDELLSVASLLQLAAGQGAVPVKLAAPKAIIAAPPPVVPAVSEVVKKNGPVTTGVIASLSSVGFSGELSPATWPALWAGVVAEVGMIRGRNLEPAGLPAILGPNAVEVRFPAGYTSQYDAIHHESSQEVIRRTLKMQTGRDVQLVVTIAAATVERPAYTAAVAPDRKKDLMQLPIFVKAVSALGAQLIKVDDGFNPYLTNTPVAAVLPAEATDELAPLPDSDPDEV